MQQRGRQSAASLQVVQSGGETARVDVVQRMRAPSELTVEEKEAWDAVVGSEPADWFTPSTVPLLAQYCRHCVRAKYVAQLIADATGVAELKDYDKLLKMQERESRALTMLATKMRISQQSVKNHRGNAKRGGNAHRPWEDSGEDEED